MVAMLLFDTKDAEQTRRAYDVAKRLAVEAGKRGYGEYRAHLDFMDLDRGPVRVQRPRLPALLREDQGRRRSQRDPVARPPRHLAGGHARRALVPSGGAHGPRTVEAHALSQARLLGPRGLGDLPRLVADLLRRGRGSTRPAPAPTPPSRPASTSSTPPTSTAAAPPRPPGARSSPAARATPTSSPPRSGARCPTTRATAACRPRRSPSRSTPRWRACRPTTSTSTRPTASTPTCRSRRRSRRCRRSSPTARRATSASASGRAEQIEAAIDIAGPDLFVSSQPQYSMLWQAPEAELFPLCAANGISQIVWSPLAAGRADRQVPAGRGAARRLARGQRRDERVMGRRDERRRRSRPSSGCGRSPRARGCQHGRAGAGLGAAAPGAGVGDRRRVAARAGPRQRGGLGHRAVARTRWRRSTRRSATRRSRSRRSRRSRRPGSSTDEPYAARTMNITRSSIDTIKGPGGLVHRRRLHRRRSPPRPPPAGSQVDARPLHAGRAHRVAHPPARPDRSTSPRASASASGAAARSRSSGPGDRVFFEPDEDHWHGAAPNRFMVHLAHQRGRRRPRRRRSGASKVTDDEYAAAPLDGGV